MDSINTLIYVVCLSLHTCMKDLWTSNREECVDARATVCTLLGEWGLTDTDISRRFGMTRQGVNKLRNNFRNRSQQKWSVRMAYREGKRVKTNS